MRFKNLTITLTLTCLSIVAIAGLVIIPITNGICASWTDNSFGSLAKKLGSCQDLVRLTSFDIKSVVTVLRLITNSQIAIYPERNFL